MSSAVLAAIVGEENLARLAAEFGGERLYIPKRPVRRLALRQVQELRAQGWPIREIARSAGVSQRTVYRQLALFR